MPDKNGFTLEKTISSLKGPIVVFGAGGFIGCNLFRTLLAARDDCFAVTHQPHVPWRLIGLPLEKILRCDITDPDQTNKLLNQYPFETIFSLACYGGYSRQTEVRQIYSTNVMGLVNLLDSAGKRGFSSFVHAGSQSEYGLNCSGPKEADALLPNSHYAVSKVADAYLIGFLARQNQLPIVNLRYHSIYGPWEEDDRLMMRLVVSALDKKLPPLVDPEISRDFVYVDDAVRATLLAAAKSQALAGQSLNIASGQKTTLRQLAQIVRAQFGVEQEPAWGTMRNRFWDLADWYGNAEKAEQLLNWTAATPLSEGLKRTADWVTAQGGRPSVIPTIKIQRASRLSAIIACYKDAQAIPIMYERLTKTFCTLQVDYEIIFVNDGSPDNTAEVAGKIAEQDEHVMVIEHSRNFGSQNAFLSGMELSTGDAVVLLDGDLQDPPELITDFFREWQKGFEVVYGRRVRRMTGWLLALCYKAFYRVLRAVSYVPIPVDAGDFSLMDRKVVNELCAMPEADQFLRGLRAWVGFRQTGVDYVRPERMFGHSTNSWLKNFWWARRAIVNFSFLPMTAMLYAGLALTALSFLLVIGQIAAKFIWPDTPQGVSTIIVLILFFGGIQILGISILGEYLGRVFEESKHRPRFIRRSIRCGRTHLVDAKAIETFLATRQRSP